MTSTTRKTLLFFILLLAGTQAGAQFYTEGTDPAGVKWHYVTTANYKIIYPEGTDSLALKYAESLEKFAAVQALTCGYSPNEMYRKPMPVVLHPFSAYANGSVSWAPRNVSLFTTPEAYAPESTVWIDQLAVHEGRHVAQMQFVRGDRFFRSMGYVLGELWAGAASALWPGPVFFEGDAVTAETALTKGGRGRSADFLEYYRVSFADSLYRNYWQWRYGSQKRYTPDYYRAGYMLAAGMRTTFDEPLFTNYYYARLFKGRLYPFYNLQKSVKDVSGLKFNDAFRKIEEDFGREWAENDSLRRVETFGTRLSRKPRLYEEYSDLNPTEGGFYAIRWGLDRAKELVFLGLDGQVKRLASFSGLHSAVWGADKDVLYWTEYRPHPRWELSSTSVLRSYDGKKHTLAKGGRIYNPCIADSLLSVTSYLPDGKMGVAVLKADDGSEQEFYRAPDGFQPVESAWVGSDIYASAISSEGFGIYRLPDWTCVLQPAQVKIKALFGEEGLLWFTCDLSGVNDLYSLDPTSGRLLQRTSTPAGADDFCFLDGRMYFTRPGIGDRAVYSIPVDSLLARELAFEALPRPRADKLSSQESLTPPEGFELELSSPERYSKAEHLFKFHSWAPIYYEYDVTSVMAYQTTEISALPGLTAWFQNDLSSSYGQIGVSLEPDYDVFHNFSGWRPAAHAQWVYAGWLPMLELKADINRRSAVLNDLVCSLDEEGKFSASAVSKSLDKAYNELALGTFVPLCLSSGGWRRGIIPSFYATFTNDRFTRLSREEVIRSGGHPRLESVYGLFTKASLKAYTMLSTPSSCIFPRWGIGGEISVTDRPLARETFGGSFAAGIYAYLPGIVRTHGLRVSAGAEKSFGSDWSSITGYYASAEYALPFLSLDWSGLCPWFYLRNFEFRAYASYENRIMQPLSGGDAASAPQAYFGASLAAHLGNFLWIPYDTLLGVKYLYNPINPEMSGVSAVFSIDL